MKAKLIDRQNIIIDHFTWNSDMTKHGMISEFDSGFLEYIESQPPNDAPEGLYYTPFYEIKKGKVYQKWELPDLSLAELKRIKIQQIRAYDSSSAVNGFFIEFKSGGTVVNIVEAWISRDDRNALRSRFEAETFAGMQTTTLWHSGAAIPMSLQDAPAMMIAIELYAAACYDCTQQHESNINAMAEPDKELIMPYDNTAGYPPKPTFTIDV
jgi:hypothetical protein